MLTTAFRLTTCKHRSRSPHQGGEISHYPPQCGDTT
jgi:hypothetical protein